MKGVIPFLWFDTQAEEAGAEGGERQPGGWLRDRYGVSWQVMARQ